MFVNPALGEIFLINSDDNTIHAASRLSTKCGINGEQMVISVFSPAITRRNAK